MKRFTDLYTVDEFIKYYKGASKRELKSRLATLKNKNTTAKKNERLAITTLLL